MCCRLISPPRQHSSCSSKIIAASAAIAVLLHRARMPWILEHSCDLWLRDLPKIKALVWRSLARPGPSRITVLLVHSTENEHCFWLGMWAAGICTVFHESVLGQASVAVSHVKNMVNQSFPHQFLSLAHHVSEPQPPTMAVTRACHGSHHERTTIAANTSLSWNVRLFTQRVKGYCCGSFWFCAFL